jgi:hypothetical protein
MSLRDALLKAGKVDKKQAQQARTENRKKRKKKGGHRIESEQQVDSLAREAERRELQSAENRARTEAERVKREREERLMQIVNLIRAWRRRPSRNARRAWHFVRSSGHVGLVVVDAEIAAELEFGSAGIVELPENEGAVEIVGAEGLRKLTELHGPSIRFYVGVGAAADDPLTCPPPWRHIGDS